MNPASGAAMVNPRNSANAARPVPRVVVMAKVAAIRKVATGALAQVAGESAQTMRSSVRTALSRIGQSRTAPTLLDGHNAQVATACYQRVAGLSIAWPT